MVNTVKTVTYTHLQLISKYDPKYFSRRAIVPMYKMPGGSVFYGRRNKQGAYAPEDQPETFNED